MRRTTAKKLSALLAAAMLLPQGVYAVPVNAQEAGSGEVRAAEAVPAYQWDFETVNGAEISNSGSVSAGNAALRGTASVDAGTIKIGDKAYSSDTNHVLTLKGGNNGSSYVDLPSELYAGVNSSTGLTWSFWMKTDPDVVKYSRVFSSANAGSSDEFAYAPYADDHVWNLIFDTTNLYRHIYTTEPEKNVWNYITITVSADKVVFYVNGEVVGSSFQGGSVSNLKTRLDSIGELVNNALGKTCSTWGDPDCKVQLDDVAVYRTALSAKDVKTIAEGYGLEVSDPKEDPGENAQEGIYQDGTRLTQVEQLLAASEDGKIKVKIWKDSRDAYYYSVSKEDKVVVECSALGMTTDKEDLTSGLTLKEDSISAKSGEEKYDLIQGSVSSVDKKYNELSFMLYKNNSEMTVIFRVFDDGIGYRYLVDADVAGENETTAVTSEKSEFTLPDKGDIWTIGPSATYENYEYTKHTVAEQYSAAANYSTPLLASLGEDSGNRWVLLSEANVYNEENPYCASVFKTETGKKSFRMTFGNYLEQEADESFDRRTYDPIYHTIDKVNMQGTFHTPWRVAVIADDLEGIANSSLITDLNPSADGDFSWVKPGGSVWSWWSTAADGIDYDQMRDYIDFAANCGMPYCLVDYGWEMWPDYETKIASLVEYANEKNVGLLLWYGVNKFDNAHIFDLDSEDAIEESFAWCERMGVKGVKVDYINSDSQFAMKVMYLLADFAAKHHLVLNYHGATNPNGEARTYPNILANEAVAGAENFKWSNGSSIGSLLTLPYTRNVLGSMEFTPTAYKVARSDGTAGFMLAMPVVYESAVQTYAASAYVYEGYPGLSLLADLPTVWDESLLLDGYPAENVIRARRNGESWYLGAMTNAAGAYEVSLDFLDKGVSYTAYIYRDNAAGTNIETAVQKANVNTVLKLDLMQYGGCVVKLVKNDPQTDEPTQPARKLEYDRYTYFEAEDAEIGGNARIAKNNYSSMLNVVGYIGNGEGNTLTFRNVKADKEGEYDLRVFFVTGSPRDLYIKVNDGEPVRLSGLLGISGDWEAVGAVNTKVSLKAGDNSICLYNNEADAPNIDRIALRDLKAEEKPEDPVWNLPFQDVNKEKNWYADAVKYVYDKGIMTGLKDEKGQPTPFFGAGEKLSRAQFATILYRMEGNVPPAQGENAVVFRDVPYDDKDCFYLDAVTWATGAGIVKGYEDEKGNPTGFFGPGDDITREQMAVMMLRYAAYKGYITVTDTDLTGFPDWKDVTLTDGMTWSVENGLISGEGETGLLNPQGKTFRSVCATIIQRFLKYVEPVK